MSDPYGIGPALRTAMQLLEKHSRGTGRTSRMLAMVKPGDQIVVPSVPLARWMESKLAERGLRDVKVIVSNPKDNPFERVPTPSGVNTATHFEHTWITEFFTQQLDLAMSMFDYIQRNTTKALPGDPPKPEYRYDPGWLDRPGPFGS